MKPGICAIAKVHVQFDLVNDGSYTPAAENMNLKQTDFKCCMHHDDDSQVMTGLLAGNQSEKRYESNMFLAGAGAGATFVAAWASLAFVIYTRRRKAMSPSLMNIAPLLA